ncbi:MAG: N-acetylmuramoyl-L-alanine amidase [bacterium]|nr:N-acetylmuramoyl-L-alanine amidase [bacterium]
MRRSRRQGFALLLVGLSQAFSAVLAAEGAPEVFDVVVVDAGHGGDDVGAKGRGGLVEKVVVLDVAKRVERQLKEDGLQVIMTRDGDRFVPLEGRTELANAAAADLFISIHANASSYKGARGIETFFAAPEATDQAALELARAENLAFGEDVQPPAAGDPLLAILGDMAATEQLTLSQEFARMAQHRIATAEAARSRGVKQAPFVVLMGVHMPAVLVEIGFLTHPEDEAALRDDDERERLAKGIAEAVAVYRERYDARRGVAQGVGKTHIR